MNNFLLLFYAFIKVGILGYGGGHSIIPFIQVEAVENYKWISMEEFTDTLAMANTLPGPIAVKMSFMVGYKTAGLNGAMVSLLGLLLPSLLMMLALTHIVFALQGFTGGGGAAQGGEAGGVCAPGSGDISNLAFKYRFLADCCDCRSLALPHGLFQHPSGHSYGGGGGDGICIVGTRLRNRCHAS